MMMFRNISNKSILLGFTILFIIPLRTNGKEFSASPATKGTGVSSSSSSSIFLRGKIPSFKLRQSYEHRLFPAAQYESYGEEDVIGFVHPKLADFSINVIGPETIHVILDPAIERFKTSLLERLPDFAEDYPVQNFTTSWKSTDKDSKIKGSTTTIELKTINIHVESSDVDLFHGVDESYLLIVQGPEEVLTIRKIVLHLV